MGLKNLAHFIGIIRGNFIELRDYDDIQDLKDGTKIIIFTPTSDEQKAFKKLIAIFKGLTQSKLQSEINSFERIPNFFEPDFLKNLGMSRQARITKKSRENEILLKRERIFALLFFIRKFDQTRFHRFLCSATSLSFRLLAFFLSL